MVEGSTKQDSSSVALGFVSVLLHHIWNELCRQEYSLVSYVGKSVALGFGPIWLESSCFRILCLNCFRLAIIFAPRSVRWSFSDLI